MKCVYFVLIPEQLIHEVQDAGGFLFSHCMEDATILLSPLVQLKVN